MLQIKDGDDHEQRECQQKQIFGTTCFGKSKRWYVLNSRASMNIAYLRLLSYLGIVALMFLLCPVFFTTWYKKNNPDLLKAYRL